MARMSISIPDDLKARTDELEAVNWSGVAQAAFQKKVDELMPVTGDERQQLVERMRRSKKEWRDEQETLGREAGRAWVNENPYYGPVTNLVELAHKIDWDDGGSVALHIAAAVAGSTVEDVLQSHRPNFFDDYGFDGADDVPVPFLQGFLDGVCDVWKDIADEVGLP